MGVIGVLKISKSSVEENLSTTENIYCGIDIECIPIGNNLMLRRELSPFTRIVKELGLM